MSFTGNSSYANNAAVAIAQAIHKEWSMVWTASHPLITVVQHNKTNFNQGFTIKNLGMLLAVMGDDQTNPAAGVATGSGEAVAMSENLTNGLSQFFFNFGHIRGNYMLLESDMKLLANGQYGNVLTAKKNQMLASFKNTISTWLSSATADQSDNSRFLGVYQPLSTSNTVGGISQATDTQIAAVVKSSAGPFALELIEDVADQIAAKSNADRNGGAAADLVLASSSSTNNVYGKYRSAIAPALRYVNKEYEVKYGLKNFEHNGMMVVMDSRIANTLSGSCAVLSSKTWFVALETTPKLHGLQRKHGTDAYQEVGTAWGGVGTNDPGLNGLVRDIS
jgi:hypothetical protein